MTIEEAFKSGWKQGYSDGGEHDCRMFTPSADKAWIEFRRAQIAQERGELAATEYYTNAMDRLNQKKETRLPQDLKCPDCSGPMVSRVNRKDQARFWGCKQYPKCTGTRDINGLSRRERQSFEDDGDNGDLDLIRWDRNS